MMPNTRFKSLTKSLKQIIKKVNMIHCFDLTSIKKFACESDREREPKTFEPKLNN